MADNNENNAVDAPAENIIKGPKAVRLAVGKKGLAAIAVVVVVMAVAIAWSIFLSFGSDDEPVQKSDGVSDTIVYAATGEESDRYLVEVEKFNKETTDAIVSGKAPTGTQTLISDIKVESVVVASDKANRYGLQTIEAWDKPEVDVSDYAAAPPVAQEEFDSDAHKAFLDYLEKSVEKSLRKPEPYQIVSSRQSVDVVSPAASDPGSDTGGGKTQKDGGATGDFNSSDSIYADADRVEVLAEGLHAVAYGVLRNPINSDIPGKAVVDIVSSGPLRGAVATGEYERLEWTDFVRIRLDSLSLSDGTDIQIEAIVLDPYTSHAAIEADIDHHYLYRYGWWGVGTALASLGEAVEKGNESVAVTDSNIVETTTFDESEQTLVALGGIGRQIADVLKKQIDRPVTAHVAASEEVGVFFLKDVVREKE